MAEEVKEIPKVEENPPVEEAPKDKPEEQSKKEDTPTEEVKPTEPQKEDNSKQIEELKTQIKELETQNIGLMVALEIGLDIKNADAVLKLADLSTAYDKNGKINKNSLRTAINKVLEEYPIFKPQNNQHSGIVIGGNGNTLQNQNLECKEKPIAQKRWNRFNN
jgi:hypothetical protein